MNDIITPDGRPTKPVTVRIYEVDIPLPTLDVDKIKENCLIPIYAPGLVVKGGNGSRVTAADGKPGYVLVGHTAGFNGGEAMIIRETSMALDALRAQISVLHKGLRASLQLSEQLAAHAQIGQDGMTATRLRELEKSAHELRALFFDDQETVVREVEG